ncbi:2-C-methyl-D-erythritol 2,4-cyclodiphosphate synthase [Rhodohalobacter sulfatireducens]|uniref:2-C-methyl-D-erythritol 2,4-cyclodiphosphate synthase n=1 Tax=Rhodohalobacter sulfatireducens TaxID=2911366 RepID=A0ABS9KGE2_9BACT|nr:2-C-methyl-D-erythritol 2,4-cyclodiphosphate synthase [Rhodohalobacter sulfatireducens]MDR9366370.1 2-C-methyl-D-erythritol 2,4-cyclodiphosphate synthase [Balneolaceae bacterium]
MSFRVGLGYDVHPFEENRKLILGGIEIPFEKGLKGHSDADVLLHAITDAILGAASLGDIGRHFPDTDPAFKNADSTQLLKDSYKLVQEKGFSITNIDSTVVAEKPKLSKFIPKIQSHIGETLNCDVEQISVKATTNEKMGFVGREEGIAVHAVVLLKRG